MSRTETLAIRLAEPAAARDAALVDELTALINEVYTAAERGIWRDGFSRTTTSEVAGLIAAGEIALARRESRLAGAVRLCDVAEDTSLFGMLVASPDQRGTGVGRALVEFAEQRARDRGMRAMRLELLVPRTLRHPSKEFLAGWYARRGYRRIGSTGFEGAYPHVAPLLLTPCDLETHEKPLTPRWDRVQA
jgi:GNAT superfamily N-acetyltransferase